MSDVFDFAEGTTPLLISIPHDGRQLMPGQGDRITVVANSLPDTDWHVRKLYDFMRQLGAGILSANYSRYVVDLNRPANDSPLYAGQVSSGLCPLQTFAGGSIYLPGETLSKNEVTTRVRDYWQPYHEQISTVLQQIKSTFGYALLWDAHSIAAEVPQLFAGVLPHLNIGTDGGASCASACEESVMSVAAMASYTAVSNARFRGGYITRHHGNPEQNVHAIQLELSQACYMQQNDLRYDAALANGIQDTIRDMLFAFMNSARKFA